MHHPPEQTMTRPKASKQRPPRRRGASVYDTLLWRLQNEMDNRHGVAYLLGITACERRTGTSTLATNLAFRANDRGQGPVLLVDAHTDRPQLTGRFRLRKGQGLADLLAGECSANEAAYETPAEGLTVMPAGTPGALERIGLDSQQIGAALDSLREAYSLVLFDLPPASEFSSMIPLARQLDGALLMVRSGKTSKQVVHNAASQLRADGVPLIGSVLSRHRQHVPSWLHRWL